MKGIITINFKEIKKEKVDENLIKKNPKLLEATRKTLLILCEQIEKYFQEHKIKVKCKTEIKNE